MTLRCKPDIRPNRGMSLLETLACICILMIVISLATQTFISGMRLSQSGQQAAERMDAIERLRVDFTESVQRALVVQPEAVGVKTGPDALALEIPARPDCDETRHLVVWGRDEAAKAVLRRDFIDPGDGKWCLSRTTEYPMTVMAVRFEYDAPDECTRTRRIALSIDVAGARTRERVNTHCFTAARRSVP